MTTRIAPIDPFLGLDFFAVEFGVSVKHLSNISLAQRGRWATKNRKAKKPFTNRQMRAYPTFIKGPGGRLGLYRSQYESWREQMHAPIPRIA